MSTGAVPRAFALAALRLTLLFAVVFYGADALAAWRGNGHVAMFGWEVAVPYLPAAWPVYFSVLALPFLPLALCRDAAEVRRWERRMAACVLAAGAVFVAWPTVPGYAAADAGGWWPFAWLAARVSGRGNLLPSLHVAFTAVTVHAVWPRAGRVARAGLAAWAALLVASVLLTHQHHLADVLAGAALAAAASRALRT